MPPDALWNPHCHNHYYYHRSIILSLVTIFVVVVVSGVIFHFYPAFRVFVIVGSFRLSPIQYSTPTPHTYVRPTGCRRREIFENSGDTLERELSSCLAFTAEQVGELRIDSFL